MSRGLRGVVFAVGAALVVLGATAASAQTEPPPATPAPPPGPPPALPPPSGASPVLAPPPAPTGAPSVSVAAPAAGGCAKDIECKGDRICVEGRCVAPNATPNANTTPNTSANTTPNTTYGPPPPNYVPSGTVEPLRGSGLSVGLRFGIGFPGGNVAPGDPASTVTSYLLPVTLDVGYRLTPHWYVGGYVSLAYGASPASTCTSTDGTGASCSETDVRAGLDLQYRFIPDAPLQPWIGIGAGWEVLNKVSSDDEEGGGEAEGQSGLEFAHLDLGADLRVAERDKLGVYFRTSFVDFLNGSVNEWFTVGARWRHDLDLWHR
jgi:hypothetical protein